MDDKKSDASAKSEQPQPALTTQTVVVQKGNSTTKTVVIVIVVLIVLMLCCCGICIITGVGTSLLATLGISSAGGQISSVVDKIDQSFNLDVAVTSSKQVGDDLVLTLKVTNNSGQTNTFSSFINATLVDDKGNAYYIDPLYDIPTDQQIDGKDISAGGVANGVIAYTVKNNPAHLTLKVKSSLLSDKTKDVTIR